MTVICAHFSTLLGFGFGTQEVLIVAVVFLVLFGGARLPGLMRNMGRSINEFKAGMKDKPERIEKTGGGVKDSPDSIEQVSNSD